MGSLLTNYGRLIRNRRYFPLWLGQLFSNLGDTLHYIALVIWVYQRTGSSLVVAGTVFFEVIPVILLAPIAGVLIDRLPRKAVLVGADLVRAILVLALLLTTEQWQIYLIVALLTAANTFFNPAVNATLPTLLDEEDLLAANAVSWSTGRFVQIIGSALAAGMIASVGAQAAFIFNAATFLISALLLLLLPMSMAARETATPGRDWPQFRGIASRGVSEGAATASAWNVPSGERVKWKTAIPGLGHSSPIVYGDLVCVSSAVSGKSDPELKVGPLRRHQAGRRRLGPHLESAVPRSQERQGEVGADRCHGRAEDQTPHQGNARQLDDGH